MAPSRRAEPQRGLLIAFDGIDSSGKETQSRLLVERLRFRGFRVKKFSTPDYSTPTGQEIKARLQNKLGDWNSTPWQQKMELFARNRAEHREEVLAALALGEMVIYDRYIPSSLAFFTIDASSIPKAHVQREQIQRLIIQREYDQNQMPREDVSIFLDLPPHDADQLLKARKVKSGDADEVTDSLAVQERLYNEYDILCKEDPSRFLRVRCLFGNQVLGIDDVSELVWEGLITRFPQLHI